jgi:hypothetical protein
MVLQLPPQLADPVVVSGKVIAKTLLDLTVYLEGPSVAELDFLLDLYERLRPSDAEPQKYAIDELVNWWPLRNPELTDSGRAAAAAGIRRPYFEPVRQRIRDGRAFRCGLWDGVQLDDPRGSWSFHCARIHLRRTGLFAFARILAPLSADCDRILQAALDIADGAAFLSGHGGLTFSYDPWDIEEAFDAIYVRARRFWGVDVEYVNGTLPLVREGIKVVNWITMVGSAFMAAPEVASGVLALERAASARVERRAHGTVLIAAALPVTGDQNRPDRALDGYYAVAGALASVFLKGHPDFPGQRFATNANTVGWLRRFLEPDGWR